MYKDDIEQQVNTLLENPAAVLLSTQLASRLAAENRKRQEFYAAISDEEKAEFINGQVIIHSPVKLEHNDVSKWFFKILDTFVSVKNLGYVGFEKIMIALTRNDYEPDVLFFNSEKSQHFKKGQWKFPVPDLVVEVLSETTKKNDRETKFKDYATHGVREYWIIDPDMEIVEQYLLNIGEYELIFKSGKGNRIESAVVAGFSIEITAIFDAKENLNELRRILEML
jgi:Uma2 family endonuclease